MSRQQSTKRRRCIAANCGDEQDAFYARSLLCVLSRAGLAAWWKRHFNKRARRAGKEEAE